jgi:hypothetical protein
LKVAIGQTPPALVTLLQEQDELHVALFVILNWQANPGIARAAQAALSTSNEHLEGIKHK